MANCHIHSTLVILAKLLNTRSLLTWRLTIIKSFEGTDLFNYGLSLSQNCTETLHCITTVFSSWLIVSESNFLEPRKTLLAEIHSLLLNSVLLNDHFRRFLNPYWRQIYYVVWKEASKHQELLYWGLQLKKVENHWLTVICSLTLKDIEDVIVLCTVYCVMYCGYV